MKKNSKDRLFEVMGRLDKTFKPTLNENSKPFEKIVKEEFEEEETEELESGEAEEKSIEEKYEELKAKVEELYSIINGGESEEHEEGETEEEEESEHEEEEEIPSDDDIQNVMGSDEETESGEELDESDKKWIQKAVNPKHVGFCTPMSKKTCTPQRKALAKRFKKGIENED